MIRDIDFNDGYIGLGNGHPSDTIAALLTPCELGGRGGRDLIAATVLTYEVFCKVLDVLDTDELGLDYSTVTGLAAVAGAGRLMSDRHPRGRQHRDKAGPGWNAVELENLRVCRRVPQCDFRGATRAGRHDWTGPGVRRPAGFFNVISRKPFILPKLGGDGEPYGIMHSFTKRFALVSIRKQSPRLQWKRGSSPRTRAKYRRSTSGSPTERSRLWRTAPISGGRKHMRPPTTACRIRRALR